MSAIRIDVTDTAFSCYTSMPPSPTVTTKSKSSKEAITKKATHTKSTRMSMSGDRMSTYLPYDTKERNSTHGMSMAPASTSSRSLGGDSKSKFSDVTGLSTFLDEGKPGLVDNNNNGNDDDDDDDDMLELENDVYAFISVAPMTSAPFLFALYVILCKYAVCGLLAYGIEFSGIGTAATKDDVVKFFLIPVAVAMQEDLMHVYASVANLIYDEEVLKITPHATKFKLMLSFLLRFIDGCFSLYVNFALMIDTGGVLNIMLNFAALHFLQGIDDVFFGLVEQGFFGDNMEHMSTVCKQISHPRRKVEDGTSNGCTTHFDSMLFFLTLAVLVAVYGVYVSGLINFA